MIAAAVGVKNPYPGLRPFEADDAEYFFGRDRQVDELLPRLRDHRFVAVLGLSGSGKSSLVRAGLIPALKAGHLTSSGSRWRIALMRPGSDPMVALAAALDQALGAAPDRLANLRKNTNALISDSRMGRKPDESLLVVVDQFEELFRVSDAREAAHFVDLLLAVEQDVSPEFRIYVVLTMRTDRLGECSRFDGLPEVLNRSQYLVPKLGSDHLREAIEGPAALTDTEIEPGLVQQLVVEASEGSDRLPLLQHLLMILWEGRTPSTDGSPLISLGQYRDAVSAADALNDHADRTLKELPTEDRRRVASLVFRALTGGGAGRDLRRPLRLSQLAAETGAPLEEVREVVEHFYAENFLTSPDRGLTPDWEADITHESLIRQWKKLSGWVAEEAAGADDYRFYSLNAARDASPLTERTLESALQWLRKGHNAAWAARYGGDFEATVRYIERSERIRQEASVEREVERRWQVRWHPIIAAVIAFSFLYVLVEYRANLFPADAQKAANFDLDKFKKLAVSLLKITGVALAFAVAYVAIAYYGKKVHHRFARLSVLGLIRNQTKEAAKGEQAAATEAAIFVPGDYARWWLRALAFTIDTIVELGLWGIPFTIVLASGINEDLAACSTMLATTLCYHAFTTGSRRQATLGMRTMRIYGAKIDGSRVSPLGAVGRQIVKIALSPFLLYWPVIYSATYHQMTYHRMAIGWRRQVETRIPVVRQILWCLGHVYQPWIYDAFSKRWPNHLQFIQRKQWLGDLATKTVVLVRGANPAK